MAILSKKQMNFVYGMGAAVVIVGALFKIEHFPGATYLLIIGLCTEAFIFALSAFEDVDEEYDWALVYPELAGGAPARKSFVQSDDDDESLSKKLDKMLQEANIDAALMSSLTTSINNFEAATRNILPNEDTVSATQKYSEELKLAGIQMESLNGLYKLQLESASRNVEINDQIAENNSVLKDEMKSLSTNLSSLNTIYGGMLSAMSNRG
jgi:gliding motility-associated protein GldL